jgi:hypothetical protein
MPACCCSATRIPLPRRTGRPGWWSWLLVVLVIAVAYRRLGPSSSARTSTVDRLCFVKALLVEANGHLTEEAATVTTLGRAACRGT